MTRIDYSTGAWEWWRVFVGRFVTESIRETLGRVVDPGRVDQSHETPVLTEEEQVSSGGQAEEEGLCGLSGTWQTCVLAEPTMHTECAGWSSLSRVCSPVVAVPGPPGGIGPAGGTEAGGAGAPEPQTDATGGAGRGSGSGDAPGFSAGECEPSDVSSAEILPTPEVSDAKLRNIVNNLYKGTTNPNRIGNGTTMDAICNEVATGAATGGRMHITKGAESLRGLENWLARNPKASFFDRQVARSLADELLGVLPN